MLDCFRCCAHHPSWFVIFAQLAQLGLIIILIIPMLSIVGMCNLAQTASDWNHHLGKQFFGLCSRQSPVFRGLRNFLLMPNCCLCSLNSLSRTSDLSLNIIFDPVLFVFTPQEVGFSSFLCHKRPFGLYAAHCPKGSDSFCPPSHCCPHSLDDVVMWNTVLICRMCQPVLAKSAFSEH